MGDADVSGRVLALVPRVGDPRGVEVVSVCPLRLAATLSSDRALKVVVKATLEPAPELELAPHQPAPEGDERTFLDLDDDARPSRAVRRLRGTSIGPARWSFDGAPPAMVVQVLPALSPRLFVARGDVAREIALSLASVELNPVTGWVTCLWTANAAIGRDEADGVVAVALEDRDGAPTWTRVWERTGGLDAAYVTHRAPVTEASSRFDVASVAMPKRSIGQVLAEARPGRAIDPASDPPSEPHPERLAPPPETRALEMLFVRDGADADVRRSPALRKLLPKSATEEDDDERARHEFGTLARLAPRTALADLAAALRASVVDGVVEPPLVVVDGALALVPDPVARLTAFCDNADVFASVDAKVKVLVERARAALADAATPDAVVVAIETALRAALPASAAPLEAAIHRELLRARSVHTMSVDGAPHARARLRVGADGDLDVAVYLPLDAAARLPLVSVFDARLIARVRPSLEPGAGRGLVSLLPIAIFRSFVTKAARHSSPPARSVMP